MFTLNKLLYSEPSFSHVVVQLHHYELLQMSLIHFYPLSHNVP